jgi:hypothetical protein
MRHVLNVGRLRAVWVALAVGAGFALSVGVRHLAVANAQASPAQPSALSVAITDVSHRALYAERTLAVAHTHPPRPYVVALAAMSYVVGHVSAPQYGYLHEIAHQPLPTDAQESLQTQAGICGNATAAMLAILNRLHVEARRVNIFYSTPHAPINGHTTLEVRYDGAWHWFDPTWGTIYIRPKTPQWDVLSLVDVLRLPPAEQRSNRIGDDSRLWARVVTTAGRSLGIETGMLFVTLPHLRVEVAGRTVYRR